MKKGNDQDKSNNNIKKTSDGVQKREQSKEETSKNEDSTFGLLSDDQTEMLTSFIGITGLDADSGVVMLQVCGICN